MRQARRVATLIVGAFLSGGGTAAADELITAAREHFAPIPSIVPAVKGNAVTRERVDLGRMLFFEPRLSRSGLFSCNSCHNLGLAGVDGLETSVGHGWQRGPRNAPTVLNAVFNSAQFWDGRAEDLKAQAKGPVQAGVEMASTPERVVATLKSMPEYVERFGRAFGLEGGHARLVEVGAGGDVQVHAVIPGTFRMPATGGLRGANGPLASSPVQVSR